MIWCSCPFISKNYTDKYGDTPNQFAADAYDVAYSIYQACNVAGVTADMSAADISAALTEQFTSMTLSGLTGQDMTWENSGEVSQGRKDRKRRIRRY